MARILSSKKVLISPERRFLTKLFLVICVAIFILLWASMTQSQAETTKQEKYIAVNMVRLDPPPGKIRDGIKKKGKVDFTGPYAALINENAKRHGIDSFLLAAIMKVESNYDTTALSPKGARGLLQVMPGTASEFGVDPALLYIPEVNINAGSAYLRHLLNRSDGNLRLTLAGYNAGPAVWERKKLPKETRVYLKKVQQTYEKLKKTSGEMPLKKALESGNISTMESSAPPELKKSERRRHKTKSETFVLAKAEPRNHHGERVNYKEEIASLPPRFQPESRGDTSGEIPRAADTIARVAASGIGSSSNTQASLKREPTISEINLSKPPEPTKPSTTISVENYTAYQRLNERLSGHGATVAHAVAAPPPEPVDPETEFYKNHIMEYQKLNERLKEKG